MASRKKTYTPKPIKTGKVQLPEELNDLLEQLAEHVHDIWAQGRIAEGWTFGPNRDDESKSHPGLVSYAKLSESEKDYDRQTALETLKGILALGYTIQPPE